jgi:hypothetical protein
VSTCAACNKYSEVSGASQPPPSESHHRVPATPQCAALGFFLGCSLARAALKVLLSC